MLKRTALGAALALAALPALAAEGERVRVTGEMVDTWCYFSGVMGGPDAVVGSAHHTCALWCAGPPATTSWPVPSLPSGSKGPTGIPSCGPPSHPMPVPPAAAGSK